jgi:hypothetical protein
MKRLISLIVNLLVYAACAAFSVGCWILLTLLVGCALDARAALPDVYVPFRWTVNTARPAKQEIQINRGETVAIEPTYQSYDGPVDLTNVYEVRLRYRSADMPADTYYSATGSVVSTTGGVVRILWGPEHETTNSVFIYDIKLSGSDSASLKASGTIRLSGTITGALTNQPSVVSGQFDWGSVEHVNIDESPFVDAGDLLNVTQRLDGHDQDIIDLTDLVGTGVAGVESNLQAHIVQAGQTNAAQDQLIALALQSANMGLDISGVSTNATVVSTRGRAFPAANDVPQDMEAMVWDAVLGGMKWGSVDLTSIWTAINNLIANAVSQTYVDTEVSRVEGMVDGNDHVLTLTESFEALDWLEIAANVWQHNTYGWLASSAIVIGGDLRLLPDVGTITMDVTNHVSRVALTGGASQYLVSHAATLSGPWTGYDVAADNIALTNRFAIRILNTGGTQVTVSRLDLYSWTHPERVGATRDFAGLTLRVDTPTGTDAREAANVGYVRNLPATGSISGSFATGFSVDKLKTVPLSIAGLANGSGFVYYSSVNEIRPVDIATQFELDAAVAPLASIAALNALTSRVSATEAGTGVSMDGEVVGPAASNRVVKLLGANLPTGTAPAQHSLVMGASGTWELKSILATNIVYAAGTNVIESVPANSAAFYRASYNGTIVGVFVLDQQVVCWFNGDGWTIPHGNLSLYEQLLESNIHLLDGSLVEPALAFVSEPGMGWHRASSGGEHVWRFGKANNAVLDIGGTGLRMAAGKTVTLADGSRAVSLAEVTGGITLAENDPLSIHQSTTEVAWTNAGGIYATAQVVATSPALSNGVASVTYAVSGTMQTIVADDQTNTYYVSEGMQAGVEMSDLAQTNWVAFAPFATPGHIRISLSDALPPPGALDTTISNIVATSWTRPDLYGQTNDTAGQILAVDTATQPRQPVPLAQMQSAIDMVSAAGWSAYPATGPLNLANHALRMGSAWTLHEVSEGLYIASHGTPFLSFTAAGSAQSGLTIAAATISNLTTTVGISTNGVVSDPMLQWTPSLIEIAWQTLTPESSTYPSTNAAGHYEIVAVLPASSGFVRAVQDAGTARADVHVPLYVQGNLVETGFVRDGTNLLWIADGVTNRLIMEAYNE